MEDKDIIKAAHDFIDVEIKPTNELEAWNCMTAYIAGFTLAFNLHKPKKATCFFLFHKYIPINQKSHTGFHGNVFSETITWRCTKCDKIVYSELSCNNNTVTKIK